MTKDPVCGIFVDETKSPPKADYHDRTYAFCSDECKEKFQKNPDRYVRTPAVAH